MVVNKMDDRTKIVKDTMVYIWNVDWATFCMDVFQVDVNTAPNHRLLYLQKFKYAWRENPASLFSLLDVDNMNRITAAAKAKYGEVNGI
tara:strand:- start:32 stop:298 length:267 start_codon:yes stop_codon:yes gene_type:complete